MRLVNELKLEDIIDDMFFDWFDDEFKNQNPDNTSHYEYENLFKKFGDDLYGDMGKVIEKKCSDRHYAIYEPIDDDYDDYVDSCYERENGV